MTGKVSKLANWRGAGQVTPSHRSPTPSPATAFTSIGPPTAGGEARRACSSTGSSNHSMVPDDGLFGGE
eukprot:CAMPEP_0119484854 /NCGR_PEP_ID=MMETSP1344-20130328/11746_1 /TAXON_ID=236787 /ORGANISM="Florenciella parvula, Strain CCMP2471" /LENGTH=68 /DNA_ID=CAMNT_0007519479 /DNA_START=352 /DNA_END=555 /DNA_ORIENTATION=-